MAKKNNSIEILIVEDSPTQAEQLKYMLEKHYYQVLVAYNGKEALELLGKHRPTIVISDIIMPEMDGYELCRRIKTDENLKDIPVILLTALSDPRDVLRGLECGADNFVTKPYDEKYLCSRIDYLLANLKLQEETRILMGIEIVFAGQKYFITSERQQILNLLISTYETAIHKNHELLKAQDELKTLNEQLEERVEERTARLVKEIDEHRQAEQRLRESTQMLEDITNGIEETIFLLSPDYKILWANKAATRKSGYEMGEILGSYCYTVTHHLKSPCEPPAETCPVRVLQETGSPVIISQRHLDKHKNEFFVDVTAYPIKNEKGEVVQFIYLCRDVTERKKAEEAEIARLQAEAASKAKSDFLANMSHELRTPLNAVIGFSEVLQDELFGELNEKQREYVDNILVSGRHLLDLINDILDLSKVESGKMVLEPGSFVLRDILNSSLTLFKEKAMKHRITLSLDIEPSADIVIEADERKFKQIMFNLLSNAVKFTPDGGSVRVSARRVSGFEFGVSSSEKSGTDNSQLATHNSQLHGNFVEISVADTGIGIKQEDIPKLFKEFTQLESAYIKKYEGTGLGLALTKRLVELHGGRIWAESEYGKGSKFTFLIPVRQEVQNA